MTDPLLSFQHLNLTAFDQLPEEFSHRFLGALSFSSQPISPDDRLLHASMPCGNQTAEVWLGRGDSMAGKQGAIRYRHDGHWLFGMIELPETQISSTIPPLQSAAESAYRQIFALLDAMEYPFSYRFWNYMADINSVSHGLERYRQFNLGRQEAFLAHGRQVRGELPAACALGMSQGPLKIAFLAGRKPALAIENPRQVSAYDYPEEYGPRSPTFSRACLLADEGLLLISGTASILGHETVHDGDAAAQTQETLANLQAVIDEANRQLNQPGFDSQSTCYRVYMRRPADKPVIEEEMKRVLGADMKAVFVQADICRHDLLLEIEATANSAPVQPTNTMQP